MIIIALVMQQESTSNGELEADAKISNGIRLSPSETSLTLSEGKSHFCQLGVIPKGDKLKEMLTNLWESDSVPKTARMSVSAFKNSKVTVNEAAADSTEFEPESQSSVSSAAVSNLGGVTGSENKNKLLLSLLQGSQATLGTALNAGNIGAVATVTPQMVMAKKAEKLGSTVRFPDVRFIRENSSKASSDVEQGVVRVATSSAPLTSGAPEIRQRCDVVNWSHGKDKVESQQPVQLPASHTFLPEKSFKDVSENKDQNILQDCLSQACFFDSPYLDKLLDEVNRRKAQSRFFN